MLSDSPPERDLEWTESGVEGAHRFIQKIWKLTQDTIAVSSAFGLNDQTVQTEADEGLARAIHKAIADIATDIERFAFNRCVAHLHILVNAIGDYHNQQPENSAFFSYAMQQLAILLSPFSPHIAEEIWHRTGGSGFVSNTSWPDADEKWLKKDVVELGVQINGKLRASLSLPVDCDTAIAEEKALALEAVQKYLKGKAPKRVIVITNRIINVVC